MNLGFLEKNLYGILVITSNANWSFFHRTLKWLKYNVEMITWN